jgi:hypothetical protein
MFLTCSHGTDKRCERNPSDLLGGASSVTRVHRRSAGSRADRADKADGFLATRSLSRFSQYRHKIGLYEPFDFLLGNANRSTDLHEGYLSPLNLFSAPLIRHSEPLTELSVSEKSPSFQFFAVAFHAPQVYLSLKLISIMTSGKIPSREKGGEHGF